MFETYKGCANLDYLIELVNFGNSIYICYWELVHYDEYGLDYDCCVRVFHNSKGWFAAKIGLKCWF